MENLPLFWKWFEEARPDLVNLQFFTSDRCVLSVSNAPVLSCFDPTPRWAPPLTSPLLPSSAEHTPPWNLRERLTPQCPVLYTPLPRAGRVGGRRDPAAPGANISIQCIPPVFPTFPGRGWHGSGRSWALARLRSGQSSLRWIRTVRQLGLQTTRMWRPASQPRFPVSHLCALALVLVLFLATINRLGRRYQVKLLK